MFASAMESAEEVKTFSDLGLCDEVVEACGKVNWSSPTEIQKQAVPYGVEGRDVIGLAETGSGKTGAFVLPVLHQLLQNPSPYFALILAPTRELAFQIEENVSDLGCGLGVKALTLIGGMDMMGQAIALARKPHIVIGTPGRVVDHLENTKGFSLAKLKFLVFDEADRLLNMDFEKEIDVILQNTPKKRTTFLFSATMTSKVAKLQRACLVDPVRVEVSKKYQTVSGLIQQYLFIPAKHKDIYLVFLLNEFSGSSCIIFADTVRATQRLTVMLRSLGFPAVPMHGQMAQPKRLGALNKFKAGESNILIATDVASRGLDIPSVDLVINYDIPTHSKDYIHRVGRTARAGRAGRALSLISQYDVELFQRIEQLLGNKMDCYATHQESVLILAERVAEAQRIAALEIRDMEDAKKTNKRLPSRNNKSSKRSKAQ